MPLPPYIDNFLKQIQPDTGMAGQILSARFEPNLEDASRAAYSSFVSDKPVTARDYADQRTSTAMKQMETIANLEAIKARTELNQQGGPGNATIKAAQAIQAENPGMTFSEAFSFAKSGLGQGMTYQPGVGVSPMTGAPQAAGAMAYGKETGQRGAELQYAAPIEAAKMTGRGEITPMQQKETAQGRVNTVISDLRGSYDSLDQGGGLSSPEYSNTQNFKSYWGNTLAGQEFGKMFGTQNQVERNKIIQARPLLTTAIMQATGLSSKQMDSNAELKLWLGTATDPGMGKEANHEALDRIEALIGGKIPVPGTVNADGINGPQGGPVNLIPQAQQGADELPDASAYPGRTITDTQTRQKYKSNGNQWVPQ